MASAPSAAAWNSAPTRRIGQYASGASRMASSPACRVIDPVGEPQADGDGDDGDRDRGEQLQGRRRHEGDAQRAHRRDAVPLADLADHLDLPLGPAVADEGGQAAHDVEEVAGQRGERRPLLLGLGLGRARRSGPRRTGRRGRVSSTMRPLSQSTQNSVASASTGTKAPATSAGRKRAAYGSTEAAPCAARVTRAVGAGAARRGRPASARRAARAGPTVDLDPDPGRDPLRGPGQHGPHGEQAGQPQRRRAQRGALDDRHDEGGERDGQPDGGHPLEDAHDRQDGDRPACSRGRPEQSRVEGPHRG